MIMKSLENAIELCGGLSALAALIGTSSARLNNWRSRGVPIECCFEVETATGGAITRRDLRPDDWQKIWPELATIERVLPPRSDEANACK
jgi:DNA-binding transcriptional regulator YdaS (Cro superfamily)